MAAVQDDVFNPWWAEPGVLHRVICDLIHAELTTLRRRALPHSLPWPASLNLVSDLGVDSLELMSLATSLSEMLHLHEAGIEDYLLAKQDLDHWASVAFTGLQQFSATLTFRTSGSSGTPKSCTHQTAWMWQEANFLGHLLAGRRRILSAVPSHHIYGFLFTVLLPQTLHINPLPVVDLRTSSPGALAHLAQPGDLIIGHPDYWRNVTRLTRALPADIIGVTSGAPCPDELARDVVRAGLARLIQIFGSSETGGMGWRDDAALPYTCFPYWQKQDDHMSLSRTLPDNTRSPFPLQDRLSWSDAQHFLPAGRLDQQVQVGGINVSPARAAQVLKQHPDVQDACVRLMRHDEGNRLKAFVVPRRSDMDQQMLAETLSDWVREQLSTPERPAAFTFGTQLPRQENGKLSDWII